ncbi:MAG: M48 family metalloprotease [Candidatus Zhuqueibacterota bacterium]
MTRNIIIKSVVSIILVGLIIWAISCAVNPVTQKREFMLLTETNEITLGQQTDGEILQTYGMYENPGLSEYINSIGQKMAKLSHRSNLQFSFKLLDSPVINAFAVPGGYVYCTRGILAYLNNEAELAGVLGHEIGHVTARHSAQQYSKAQVAQLGLGLGVALSETFRKYAGIANFGVGMLFLRFSRDNERQADALGVEYSTRAGFDANHMANFFETLERLNPGSDRSGLPAWFSTHPNPPDRIAAVKRDTQAWQTKVAAGQFQVNADSYLSKINGMIYGEDPQQGYVEGGIFYHPQLRFQFAVPAGWQLNNTPSQVQIFNEKQDAVILFSVSQDATPAVAATNFSTSSGAVVRTSEATRVNGLTAQHVVSDLTHEGAVYSFSSYFIQKDGKIFAFHGYTTQAQLATYLPAFNQTMTQFKNLTDATKINVKPAQLVVKKTTSQTSLRTALQQFGVAQDKLEEIAILNGRNLDDTVSANTMIKVVVK